MRLFVKLYTSSDYHVVPFKEGDETVSSLLIEIAKRIDGVDSSYHLRLVSVGGGAVLCPSDKVKDVLSDEDYLIVGKFNVSGLPVLDYRNDTYSVVYLHRQ